MRFSILLLLALISSAQYSFAQSEVDQNTDLPGKTLYESIQDLAPQDRDIVLKDFDKEGIDREWLNEIRVESSTNKQVSLVASERHFSNPDHLFFIGARLGWGFYYGFTSHYQYKNDRKTVFGVEAEFAHRPFLNQYSIGGDLFIGKKGFFVEGKYYRTVLTNDMAYPVQVFKFNGFGGGFGFQQSLFKDRVLVRMKVAMFDVLVPDDTDALIPDASIGVSFRLFKAGKRK